MGPSRPTLEVGVLLLLLTMSVACFGEHSNSLTDPCTLSCSSDSTQCCETDLCRGHLKISRSSDRAANSAVRHHWWFVEFEMLWVFDRCWLCLCVSEWVSEWTNVCVRVRVWERASACVWVWWTEREKDEWVTACRNSFVRNKQFQTAKNHMLTVIQNQFMIRKQITDNRYDWMKNGHACDTLSQLNPTQPLTLNIQQKHSLTLTCSHSIRAHTLSRMRSLSTN